MFKTNDLHVKYGNKIALRNLSVNFNSDGQICGLFGPNGAGKTTLMNVIVGNINRFKGSISRPKREQIAFLPDHAFLYPWLTVKDCLDLFERRHPDFRREVAVEIIEGSGLKENSLVKECSKGMSERLHLSLIIARSSQYYILDEPLAAVDPFTRDHLVEMIKQKRNPNSVVLISTHLISDVDSLFEDVMMISDGQMLYYGDAEYLRKSSAGSLEESFKQMVASHG